MISKHYVCLGRAVATKNTGGKTVYLALRSVGSPSSRIFPGSPYLSLALPPQLPPPPRVRKQSLENLKRRTE